ncbi:MAG: TetR/AcrR family transcriptional regulator [Bacteroidales bacterium]|nr:TetR/AcrR family transcriptional regulator [Bacteroidales bacterium]
MSPRTRQQNEEIRESKRTLIMNTALKLFAEEGYYITSMSKIASSANISKGLIYNYFESKENLLTEIFYHGMHEMLEDFDPNHDGILTRDELVLFINDTFQKLKSNVDFWKLYFILIMNPPIFKIFEERLKEFMGPMIQPLEDYFSSKGSKDPKAEARMFLAILDGFGMHYVFDPQNFPIDTINQIFIEKYL